MKTSSKELREIRSLNYLLLDMVRQNCGTDKPGEYDAGFISTHATAMRHLCQIGMLEMVNDGYGRCVQCQELTEELKQYRKSHRESMESLAKIMKGKAKK